MIDDPEILRKVEEDVRTLRAVIAGEGIRRIQAALKDPSLDWQQLTQILPERLVWMAIGLLNPDNARSIKEQMPENHRHLVEEAVKLVKEHLGSVKGHPAVRARFREEFEPRVKPLEPGRLSLVATPVWVDSEDKLAPLVRVAVTGVDDKVTVFATMDWDDVVELADNALNLLLDGVERARRLHDLGLLDLWYPERIRKGLRDTESKLSKIKEIAPTIGLDLGEEVASVRTRKRRKASGNKSTRRG